MTMTTNMKQPGQVRDVEAKLRTCFTRERVPVTGQRLIDSIRMEAWKSFSRQVVPSRKVDDWKRVDLTQIPWQNYEAYLDHEENRQPAWQIDAIQALTDQGVVSGTFQDALTAHPEIIEKGLIDPDRDLFGAMAVAFESDGFFIRIPAGLKLKHPVHIGSKSEWMQARLFNHIIWLEPDAEAHIILEDVQSQKEHSGPGVSNGNLGIFLDEGAKLTFVEIASGSDQAWKISHEKAYLQTNSQLDWVVCVMDGVFNKQFIQTDLAGQGSTVRMAGLYLPSGQQQVEFNTRQNHYAANTKSDLLYKGVLLDESRSLFSGMIHVAPGAVKTDGYQANRNLILGAHAHADTLPGLEILTDDVRCTHGATVGKIDPTEQFYLQSRGLGRIDAQKLIVQGFLDPVVQMLPGETERTIVQEIIERKLSTHE
jgi:Fe-S cluster assembly protein SufD